MTKTHKSGNNYHDVTERLIDVSENTLNRLDDAVDSLQKQRKKYTHQVEKYVQSNPTKSIGFAFLAGFGLAIILRGLFK